MAFLLELRGDIVAFLNHAVARTFDHLSDLLDLIAIPRLSESELSALGHLSWETYLSVRAIAEQVSPVSGHTAVNAYRYSLTICFFTIALSGL